MLMALLSVIVTIAKFSNSEADVLQSLKKREDLNKMLSNPYEQQGRW